jgi:hypothetical protein
MVAVHQDFGLHYGNEPVGLADGGIARKNISILVNGKLAGFLLGDLKDAAPLGESGALLVVVSATLS